MTIECTGCGDEVALEDTIFEEHMTSVMYVTETVPYCEECGTRPEDIEPYFRSLLY